MNINGVKKIKVKKMYSDKHMSDIRGNFIDKVSTIINYDCDVYDEKGEIILKFRKNIIPEKLCKIGYDSYSNLGFSKSNNRGDASGRIDKKGKKTYRKFDKKKGSIYETDQNTVNSGIMGYLDSPNWKKPYRVTQFTRKKRKEYTGGIIFIEYLNKLYKELLPEKYKYQENMAKKSKLTVGNTVFSTVTVNANFRTALHRDSGNLKDGMAVFTVIERGKYSGGDLLFPQYDLGVSVRSRDLLIMENNKLWHCNNKIIKKK